MPNPNPVIVALQGLQEELQGFIQAATQGHLEMDAQDIQLMQQAVTFQSCPEETYVIVLVKSRQRNKNPLTKIKCHKGVPLVAGTYDNVNECYCVECADHFALGVVPISFRATIGNWMGYVPMPESVLMKYLNSAQKEQLAAYKAKFNPESVTFDFLQLLQ